MLNDQNALNREIILNVGPGNPKRKPHTLFFFVTSTIWALKLSITSSCQGITPY